MPTSAHPGHVMNNIPFSHLAYRLRRMCGNNELFEVRVKGLGSALASRGYNRTSLGEAFERERKVVQEKEKQNRVRFVIKFDPRLPDIRSILKRQLGQL